jgi:hypothetical protein
LAWEGVTVSILAVILDMVVKWIDDW